MLQWKLLQRYFEKLKSYQNKIVLLVEVLDQRWLPLNGVHRVPRVNQQLGEPLDPVFGVLKKQDIDEITYVTDSIKRFLSTVLVYYDHPWVSEMVAVLEWWLLFRSPLCYRHSKSQKVGCSRQVVAILKCSLTQV